ncbi:MAG: hypothetical protein ISR26_09110 [Porticoccaceae bacterium]|jgi:hypothetical protein|nr:hypothetical protein [Porticoccaceae bacterium]
MNLNSKIRSENKHRFDRSVSEAYAKQYETMAGTPVFMIDREGNFYSFKSATWIKSRRCNHWV